jgi:hypothetical protein
MQPLPEDAWNPWTPDELSARLRPFGLDWYVVGGWALDLWHGHQTRAHHDLEFAVPLGQVDQARKALSDLTFFAAKAGALTHLAASALVPDDVWQLWGAEAKQKCWRVDLMIERGSLDHWVYKRDPGLTLPRTAAIHRTGAGLPYLAPGLVLLFKAKRARDKDELDFRRAIPRLKPEESAALRGWLQRLHPGHDWIGRL